MPTGPLGSTSKALGFSGSTYVVDQYDPLLSMIEWAAEPADLAAYGPRVIHDPTTGSARHMLVFEGIVDTHELPPLSNAASLSLGIDLGGDWLDSRSDALKSYTPLGSLLVLAGRQTITLPVSENVVVDASTSVTGVVVQHPSDGIEDGHEVVFQTDGPKKQYRCFLEGLAKGSPAVPIAGGALDACN
jgi:hypothetical protein